MQKPPRSWSKWKGSQMTSPSTDTINVRPYRDRLSGGGGYAKENWFACAHILDELVSFVVFWIEPRAHAHTAEELVSRMVQRYDTGRGTEILGYGVINP